MELLVIVLGLFMLDLAAMRWGANSIEDWNNPNVAHQHAWSAR